MTNNEKDLLEVIDENFRIISVKIDLICERLKKSKSQSETNAILERLTNAQELFERLSREKTELIKEIIDKYNKARTHNNVYKK